MKVLVIAQVAHLINIAYAASLGEAQPSWDDIAEQRRNSIVAGVEMHLANPDTTPEQSHESWYAAKQVDGWSYGEVLDAEKKQHPCFLPYDQLPAAQKVKDYLFRGVVHALKDIPDADEAAEAIAALQAELVAVNDKLLAAQQSVATPVDALAVSVIPAGYVAVKYIGRRPDWTDLHYDTGLYFVEGQTRAVPGAVAAKLLRHADLFERGELVEVAADAVAADTSAQDAAKKAQKEREDETETFAIIDQVNQMTDKDALVDFAMSRYQFKVAKNTSIENMRAKVVEHINRIGAVV